MAEYALSYVITLIMVCNISVILGLVAVVVLLPRLTRRRPTHRAETAPRRARLTPLASRPAARASAPTTARAA